MLGDVLKRNLYKLSKTSIRKSDQNAFWKILQEIAKEEIIEYGDYIDSGIIIPIYYDILLKNINFIPYYYQNKLPSNNQERFRVIIRNIFSSNAFHTDGLASQKGIVAYKELNEDKKGYRIVFKKS